MSNTQQEKLALCTAYKGRDVPGNEETAALERAIADTRKSLAMTLVALERQLNPEQLRVKVDQQIDRAEARVRVLVHDKVTNPPAKPGAF